MLLPSKHTLLELPEILSPKEEASSYHGVQDAVEASHIHGWACLRHP